MAVPLCGTLGASCAGHMGTWTLALLLITASPRDGSRTVDADAAESAVSPFVGGGIAGGVAAGSTVAAVAGMVVATSALADAADRECAAGGRCGHGDDFAPVVAVSLLLSAPLVTGIATGVIVRSAGGGLLASLVAGSAVAVLDVAGFVGGAVVGWGVGMGLVVAAHLADVELSSGSFGEGSLPVLLVVTTTGGALAGGAVASGTTTAVAVSLATCDADAE